MNESVDRKPVDRWLPWLFVLFFAVVLTVNAIMVYFAASSWTGIETKQSYLRGLDYNRTLDAVERQKVRRWTGDLSVAPHSRGGVHLDLTLVNARKRPIAGAEVTVRLVRPTHEGHDVEVKLDDYGNGHYIGNVRAPLPGQWDIRLLARHSTGDFRLTRRVVVP